MISQDERRLLRQYAESERESGSACLVDSTVLIELLDEAGSSEPMRAYAAVSLLAALRKATVGHNQFGATWNTKQLVDAIRLFYVDMGAEE